MVGRGSHSECRIDLLRERPVEGQEVASIGDAFLMYLSAAGFLEDKVAGESWKRCSML